MRQPVPVPRLADPGSTGTFHRDGPDVRSLTLMFCPRCQTRLELFTRHGAPDSMPIAADMCLSCGGLWLDAAEVATAYPKLAVLEERRGDALAAGEAGTGIPMCPRCEMPAVEVPFFDLRLDMCSACHGVWIDGDEIEALSRTLDRGDGLPVADVVVGGYRTAAAGVMTKHLATCAACRKQVPLRTARVSAKGTVCEDCQKEMAARGAGDAGDEDYVIPKEPGVWSFLCDVGDVIGALLASAPRCPSCGCRTPSHCGHV